MENREQIKSGWFIDIHDCCGCGACEQICPKACITMLRDSEGFEIPQKELSGCIQCNRCQDVCPVFNQWQVNIENKECYACRTLDEDLLENSSSGGVFTHLAEVVLEYGGIVLGAAFDENWNVKLLAIKNKTDIYRLRGSKYVAASVRHTYQETKKALQEEKWVLYSGTPCQIAGLKHYLGGKNYETLITVDIMCHGVPSPKVWNKYLEEIAQNKIIKQINFRSKVFGWDRYALQITDNEKDILVLESNSRNIYMRGFLNNLYNRRSCSKCPARGFNNGSDITIGDYWELERQNDSVRDNKGMSLVIIHTHRGKSWIERIKNKMEMTEVDYNGILSSGCHRTLLKSASAHPNRSHFFRCLDDVNVVSDLIELELQGAIVQKENFIKTMGIVLHQQYHKILHLWRKR